VWQALAPWEASLVASMPYWLVRSGAGLMIIVGQFLFAYNMWMTARGSQPVYRPAAQPA
jgi:cbb3-type cytochrome oxidase subunit 1